LSKKGEVKVKGNQVGDMFLSTAQSKEGEKCLIGKKTHKRQKQRKKKPIVACRTERTKSNQGSDGRRTIEQVTREQGSLIRVDTHKIELWGALEVF